MKTKDVAEVDGNNETMKVWQQWDDKPGMTMKIYGHFGMAMMGWQ